MLSVEEGREIRLTSIGERGGRPRARPRILLIDFDPELAEILTQLMEDGGSDVVMHTCPSEEDCRCVERVKEAAPDLILINVAHPDGWYADLRGWHCLERLRADAAAVPTLMLAYSVFDHYTLREMDVEPDTFGVKVYTGLSSPGHLADEVARAVRHRTAA
jgi:CheY-like chemotaxis protein